ncbi:mycothiol synthase [Nocardioides sp.]|uniref:mycothiol synthase n=1 Tax=Nocardioides sp. TaxID=35761 RepID=UPI002B8C80CC|nr:mycothiol synthase [Nocardioides sp.]HSX67345.1 mycothiol synthase [Nocardioides sp.]
MPEQITTYDDAAAASLTRISAACREGDGREPLDEAARLHLRHHGLHDAALWLSGSGFALLRRHASTHSSPAPTDSRHHSGHGTERGGSRFELDLAVAPDARRTGQGAALLEAALTATDGPVTAWSHGDHPGAAALAARHGFRRTRELLVLARPLGAASTGPHDPRIRTWREEDADELLRVNAAAFAHHPEQGAMDRANLAERMAEPWFDPAGLLVAVDPAGATTGRLLGFHWTKVHDNGHGEVYVVAVDPASHGQGVGGALLRAGLDHLAGAGCPAVHLYVEADNTTALALYRGLGFTTDHAHVQYARP